MHGPDAHSLVLASASPRRSALLAQAGIPFQVVVSAVDETPLEGESASCLVQRLARAKAESVAESLGAAREERWVLGADTIVVLERNVLGKPRDSADAEAILSRLVGRTHRVLTAVTLARGGRGQLASCLVESQVRMCGANAAEIRRYVATGEPLDKAGAYAVQGLGRRFVAEIRGSETNVIGLPLDETLEMLRDAGAPWPRQ
jgi:septum formation protein